jgi:hypothetical protein
LCSRRYLAGRRSRAQNKSAAIAAALTLRDEQDYLTTLVFEVGSIATARGEPYP